jgi:hypothetical protein
MRLAVCLSAGMFMVGCGPSSAIEEVDGAVEDGGPTEEQICGATVRDLPIPFDYTLATDHLAVQTAGGPLTVTIGPWGAHTPPHTGHPEGNVKVDWVGYFAPNIASPLLHRLDYDGGVIDGPCTMGALCGMLESDVVARVPYYTFPDDEVRIVGIERFAPSGTDPWYMDAFDVSVELCPYRYTLGHVGAISDELAEAMLAAGYVDPRNTDVVGSLITEDPITVAAGTPLGRPHMFVTPIANNPGYVGGGGTSTAVPNAQIEWAAIHIPQSNSGAAYPEYGYMSSDVQAALSDILVAQGSLPDSFRYSGFQDWLYKVEQVLVATEPGFARSGSAELTGGVGGWWEQPLDDAACTLSEDAACDQVFSIFRIHEEGALYDASLYHSADISHLVYRRTWSSDLRGFGELISPTTTPDPYSGVLLVKWRDTESDSYQRIAYHGDADTGSMMLRYGAAVDVADVAGPDNAPQVTALEGSETCDGVNVLCMRQQSWGRF